MTIVDGLPQPKLMLTDSSLQSVKTALETSGEPTVAPFATSQIPKVTATLSVAPIKGIDLVVQQTTAPKVVNIFDSPIGTGALPAGIGSRSDHPVPRLNIVHQSSAFLVETMLTRYSRATRNHPSGRTNFMLDSSLVLRATRSGRIHIHWPGAREMGTQNLGESVPHTLKRARG